MLPAAAISIEGLNHWYGEGTGRRQVLQSVSLDVLPGEVIFLMGPSGCGKTTVLTLVGGLRSIQEGSVFVCGQQLKGATQKELLNNRRNIGFIFQHHNLHRSLSVIDNVFMGLEATKQSASSEALTRCAAILAKVGLADHMLKRQDQISGGQKQRVAIARALVSRPKIILADEPTAALDSHTGLEIVSLMHKLAKESGTSVLIVTHDERILHFADRIIRMEDGRILDVTSKEAESNAMPTEMEKIYGFLENTFAGASSKYPSRSGGGA